MSIIIENNKILRDAGYELIKEIGEGAFSKVYLSVKINKDHLNLLVCKVIDKQEVDRRFSLRFLQRELKVLSKIRHPHIIHVHRIFQREEKVYILMSYADRGDLFDYIVANGVLSEIQCAEWSRQIASAIQYLHTLDIAHRDLKCENILISKNFNIKLCDFGFARNFKDSDNGCETYCGSLNYAAPEILNSKPYNAKKADMWSFGIIIYIMLNKSLPFSTSNISLIHRDQITRNWKLIEKYSLLLSAEVKDGLRMLLEPIPEERWNIKQFLESDWMQNHACKSKLKMKENAALEEARNQQTINIEEESTSKSLTDCDYSSLSFSKEYSSKLAAEFVQNNIMESGMT